MVCGSTSALREDGNERNWDTVIRDLIQMWARGVKWGADGPFPTSSPPTSGALTCEVSGLDLPHLAKYSKLLLTLKC